MQLYFSRRPLLAVVGVFAVAAAVSATPNVTAEEPHQPCQRPARSVGNNIFAQIPYIGRLFVANCESCDKAVEPIGIDFMLVDGELLEANGHAAFVGNGCQVCPLPQRNSVFAWHAAEAGDKAACTESAVQSKCCAGQCCACTQTACSGIKAVTSCCEVKCGTAACCEQLIAKPSSGTCPVKEHWEEITELVAENAAMEATLEAREELLETRSEMFETLAETMIEKAKLEAKLEMVEHRDAMLKEMVELHAENARLKAQSELAQQKEELLRSQLATVLENERLKLRVAELEQSKHAGSITYPVTDSAKCESDERMVKCLDSVKNRQPVLEPVSENANPAVADRLWSLIGIKLAPLSEDEFKALNSRYRGGLKVVEVREGSPAYLHGVRTGDVLVGFHVWETLTLENMAYILDRDAVFETAPIVFYVVRGSDTLYGHLPLAARWAALRATSVPTETNSKR